MLKILSSFIFLILTNMIIAQKTNEAVFFTKNNLIKRFHTINDLENLKKGDLIKLYQERVEEIVIALPLLSLTNEAGLRLSDLGIKEDSKHLKVLKNNTETTRESLEVINKTIEELVAYADTEKIIWAILYYEEVIKKMRLGSSGNF
ncbi:hypothetical protein [Aquimarina algicola]|uniref:Uncharacterized protein n=1 Tax=Aquimarina algicola TaxID=2589995 RepID=A0A504JEF3_9FLAO|nr:hypothetical protein [Aquimarina algicola]TPN85993.1 hypothetical protein FHK87_12005 [Aquimarina algicola]